MRLGRNQLLGASVIKDILGFCQIPVLVYFGRVKTHLSLSFSVPHLSPSESCMKIYM
jgi:hypothetical protein